MMLSICIPTYQRGHILAPLIMTWLAATKETDFEIVVLDNASQDGSYEALSSIKDVRVKVHRNNENIGSWENIAAVLQLGSGKYSMIQMDKDLIRLDRISEILGCLSQLDVAAGLLVPNLEGDLQITHVVYGDQYEILKRESLKFVHPSGYFFKTELIKQHRIFEVLRKFDPIIQPYSTDCQVLLLSEYGAFAEVRAPLVKYQLPPFEGVKKSYTYKQDKNLFFTPDYLYRMFVAYVQLMRHVKVGLRCRLRALKSMVPTLSSLSVKGYRYVLKQDNICDWYGLDKDFREREKKRSLRKEFIYRMMRSDGIYGIDALMVRLISLCVVVLSILPRKK